MEYMIIRSSKKLDEEEAVSHNSGNNNKYKSETKMEIVTSTIIQGIKDMEETISITKESANRSEI